MDDGSGRIGGRLRGKVAVITGAGHGIGRYYATRFAREGAKVVIADLDGDAAAEVAGDLTSQGYEALGTRTDVTSTEDLANMVDAAVRRFGTIDVLVNNAGVMAVVPMSRVPFDEVSEEEWDLVLDINLKGTWLACRAVVPVMRKAGHGKIINVGSTTALKGSPGRIHYVASKGGITSFTRTLARELASEGILVNSIAPGSTLSEEDPSDEAVALREAAVRQRSIPRVQDPSDLEGPVVFLASDDSDFITGQSLVIDGGSYLQ